MEEISLEDLLLNSEYSWTDKIDERCREYIERMQQNLLLGYAQISPEEWQSGSGREIFFYREPEAGEMVAVDREIIFQELLARGSEDLAQNVLRHEGSILCTLEGFCFAQEPDLILRKAEQEMYFPLLRDERGLSLLDERFQLVISCKDIGELRHIDAPDLFPAENPKTITRGDKWTTHGLEKKS